MSSIWRYENSGTADTLTATGTTLTDLPETKSVTGTAFYQTAREKCFDLPSTPEIWLKFDVYFDGTNRWRAYNGGNNGACGVCSYVDYANDFGLWRNSTIIQEFSGVCKKNQLQTVLLHMISGVTAGVIEAWVDGTKIYTYTGDVNHGQDFADIYLQSDGAGTFFSNVVISNGELSNTDGVLWISVDVERLVANRIPSSGYWRYENPGSGDYILNHNNINTETVGFDKSVTGVAFWGGDRNDMVGVPAGCKELWVRLDLFLDAGIVDNYNTTSFSFGSTSSDSASINLCGYSNLVWTLPEQSGWSLCIGNTMYFTLTPGELNSILLYLRSGKTDGMIQGTVKGTTATYTGYVNGGGDFFNLFFTSSKAAALYSNIVISNAPLSLEDGWHREPAAVELNIKAVDLCVRKNGRTYAIPFSTTSNPPANSVVARVGRKTVYNPLVTTTDENASALKVRYNGEDRALSASFN